LTGLYSWTPKYAHGCDSTNRTQKITIVLFMEVCLTRRAWRRQRETHRERNTQSLCISVRILWSSSSDRCRHRSIASNAHVQLCIGCSVADAATGTLGCWCLMLLPVLQTVTQCRQRKKGRKDGMKGGRKVALKEKLSSFSYFVSYALLIPIRGALMSARKTDDRHTDKEGRRERQTDND